MYYVYTLLCGDGTHYTGLTKHLCKRMREHTEKLPACAKYTRYRQIQALAALWQVESRSDAAKLEWFVKHLPTARKLALLEQPESILERYGEKIPASCRAVPGVSLEQCLSGAFEE